MRQLIIASNRGPVEYYLKEDGTYASRRSPGGMVTAMLSFARSTRATWVSMAVTPGDRLALERSGNTISFLDQTTSHEKGLRLRSVLVEEDAYRKYYNILSTELLWFTHNYLYDLVESAQSGVTEQQALDAWVNGYCIANCAIADAVCEEIGLSPESTVIMLQDNLLYLVSSLIRQRYPKVLIQQFLHWPWPDIRYLSFLPSPIIQDLYQGLAGCDIIGFQTERDLHNFVEGVNIFLPGAIVAPNERAFKLNEHHIWLRSYPISISVEEERQIVQSREAKEQENYLMQFLDKKIIVRIDRMDPIKNIIRGFQAYEQLLITHPELQGKVHFLAFLLPTRENAALYQRYKDSILSQIEEINRAYGNASWTPIHPFVGNNRVRSLVALQWYDVLLVNSIADGMNLIAKEGPAVNQRDGVLVLSRSTGAFEQLGRWSLPVSPTNVTETAQALYQALTMSSEERRTRATGARETVERENLDLWIERQHRDIRDLFTRRGVG